MIVGYELEIETSSIYSMPNDIDGFKEWFENKYDCVWDDDFEPLDVVDCDEDVLQEFYSEQEGKYFIMYDDWTDYFKVYRLDED